MLQLLNDMGSQFKNCFSQGSLYMLNTLIGSKCLLSRDASTRERHFPWHHSRKVEEQGFDTRHYS